MLHHHIKDSEVGVMDNKIYCKIYTRCEDYRISKVLEYSSGTRIEIPVNKDGSVRWVDDSRFLKKDKPSAIMV